jgi:hypothetical protein
MSFDIYVNWHRNGEFASLPVTILEQIFGSYAHPKTAEWWDLRYPDGGHGALQIEPDAENRITNFTVTEPPGDPLFWEGILKILQETPAVLFWPGDDAIIVGSNETIDELPKDMVEALGTPTVVSTVAEILARIHDS